MFKIRDILKFLNSLPFPLTINHYFAFDDATDLLKDGRLNSSESWDALRRSHPHFSISEDRKEWIKASEVQVKKDGQDGGLVQRARDIVGIINRLGITSVFSVGVGGAGLEYQIKKMKPDLRLICSEYSPVAVNILTKVFHEADSVILFDMKNDDWSVATRGVDPDKQLCLLYRIDIDFTNEELRNIFDKMSVAGVCNILVVLCGRLTLRGLFNRLRQRLVWKVQGIPYSFAGHLRTTKTFPGFWQLYTSTETKCGGLTSFLLRKKTNHAS